MSRRDETRRAVQMMRVAGQNVPRPLGLGRDELDPVRHHLIPKLAQYRPAAGVAYAILKTSFAMPVPIDTETLIQSGDPLETAQAILDHYNQHDDGVGVLSGSLYFGGVTLLAIEASPDNWDGWRREHGSEIRWEGQRDQYVTALNIGYNSTVVHFPPPAAATGTTYIYGDPTDLPSEYELGETIRAKANLHRTRTAWHLWRLYGDWRWKGKQLGDGVRLLPLDSPVPYWINRPDGLIRGEQPIIIDQLPPWLGDKLGVKPA